MSRPLPNILITGTPGTGKTTIAETLVTQIPDLKHIELSKWAIDHRFAQQYDSDFKCHVLNEDALLDALEPIMEKGGVIIDFHGAEMFPERWFDLVVVTCTDNEVLYPRLEARGYSGKKLEDNMECEIMRVLLEEARESYQPEIVREMQNDTITQLTANVDSLVEYVNSYVASH